MSGTSGRVKKREFEARAALLQREFAARNRQRIEDNNTVALTALEKLLLDFAGWQDVDSWAREAIERIRRGEAVDLEDLTAKINAWRAQNVCQPQNQ